MRSNHHRIALAVAVAAVCLTTDSIAFAQKKPSAAYKIIDLRSPYHAGDGNWSSTTAERISSVDPATGLTYICGDYGRSGGVPAGVRRPCLWSVSGTGSVTVTDLDGVILPNDVNAAGIVGGMIDSTPVGQPAVWHPNFGVVHLPVSLEGGGGWVTAINDPDAAGVCQAVGLQEIDTPTGSLIQGALWTITEDGVVAPAESISDVSGVSIHPYDINNAGVISGLAYVDGSAVPLVAWFDETDTLQVEYLPNPDPAILYWRDVQIDNAGNVVGDGAEPIAGSVGQYSRAVVWPATGPAVSLSSLTSGGSTMGKGIATVSGVMKVVGSAWTNNTGWYATLYSSGKLTDLTKVSKGTETWSLYEGHGVNSAGMICGRGRVGSARSAQNHGYVLIPNAP